MPQLSSEKYPDNNMINTLTGVIIMRMHQLLFEAKATKTVAIYPGRFHPFHKGHKFVYDYLSKKYGTVYIATSDKQEEGSPFSFEEKKKMMILTGVPANRIVNERQPYIASNIVSRLDPKDTGVVFGVGKKDMEGDSPRFKIGLKKNGEPTYYQNNTDDKRTHDEHGYLEVVPTQTFKVLGEPATSATELRKQYATLDDASAIKFIEDLFGKHDVEVQNIMDEKLGRK